MAVRASKFSYHERVARRNILRGLLFISPAILGFFIFTVFPIITSLYYSFTNYNILQPATWIGFENYSKLFQDRFFIISLKNTLFMVFIGLSIHFTFDFLIALLLNTKIRGISIFRTIFYLPTITPVVASAVLWLWIFNGRIGLLNGVLNSIGLAPLGWLTDPNLTKPSYIMMGLWAGGQTILIFLAGLQDVPTEQLEFGGIRRGRGTFENLAHYPADHLAGHFLPDGPEHDWLFPDLYRSLDPYFYPRRSGRRTG